jgi:hypothetical protein
MDGVYLSVTIDTECDKGPGWLCRKPLSFDGVLRGLPLVLEPLFRWARAKGSYLLSPEVLRDVRCAELLHGIDGADFGTHLHGEFAESSEHIPDATNEFQRDYSPDVERSKLTLLTQLFRDRFDRAPETFRAGRFGIGPASVGILQDLGYRVESSVTPHMRWDSAGAPGLSFVGAPTQPYHPDPANAAREGTSTLWEVPVTIRPRFEHGALRNLPRAVARHIEPRWLRPTKMSGASLVELAKDEIAGSRAARPKRPVFLTCMFHNVEITPGTSPYAQSEAQAANIIKNLAGLLTFARSAGIAVVGLSELPALLEGHEAD